MKPHVRLKVCAAPRHTHAAKVGAEQNGLHAIYVLQYTMARFHWCVRSTCVAPSKQASFDHRKASRLARQSRPATRAVHSVDLGRSGEIALDAKPFKTAAIVPTRN